MLQRLTETKSWIDQNPLCSNPGLKQRLHALIQKDAHLVYDVDINRLNLHRTGLSLHVHDTERRRGVLDRFQCTRLPECGDVIDQIGARVECRFHHTGLDGVDRQGNPQPLQSRNHWNDTLQFFSLRNTCSPWPRRLTADIDQIRPLLHRTFGRPQRMVKSLTAVAGKGIFGDVDDGHDLRTAKIELETSTTQKHISSLDRGQTKEAGCAGLKMKRTCLRQQWPAPWGLHLARRHWVGVAPEKALVGGAYGRP